MGSESEILKDLEKEIIQTVSDLQKVGETVKAKSWKEVYDLVPTIVKEVENLGQINNLGGNYKRELAISTINYFVDIPIVPEWAESKIIGFVLDAIIGFLNKVFGHEWIKKNIW